MTALVEHDDPNRCQATRGGSQCRQQAVPGTTLCQKHGGKQALQVESRRQYDLADAKTRLKFEGFLESPNLRSLREEIALVRVLIERLYNSLADNPTLLLANTGPLNSLLLTLEKLVKTTHQQEKSLGELLTREQVLAIARELMEAVYDEFNHIPGFEEASDRVSNRMLKAVIDVESVPVEETHE